MLFLGGTFNVVDSFSIVLLSFGFRWCEWYEWLDAVEKRALFAFLAEEDEAEIDAGGREEEKEEEVELWSTLLAAIVSDSSVDVFLILLLLFYFDFDLRLLQAAKKLKLQTTFGD